MHNSRHPYLRAAVIVVVAALTSTLLGAARAGAAPTAGPAGVTSGLLTWLDASDPDADGTVGNDPADGASVSTWKDKSGNGNDAVTDAGQNPGTYASSVTGGINGKPVVRFDRVNNNLGSVYNVPGVDLRPVAHEDVTAFVVYRPRAVAMENGVFGTDNGYWDRFYGSYNSGFGNGTSDGVASLGPVQQGVTIPGAGISGTVRLMTTAYNGAVSAGTNSGPVDGSAIYFNGEVVRRFTDSTDPTDAQTSVRLGNDGDNSVFDGDIAEFIVYDRILSAADMAKVDAYLGAKYNLDLGDAPTWSDATLATPVAGRPYSDGVAATGTAPITYLILGAGGPLPAGLTLNPATGAITGTPTTPGPYGFTLIATNAFGSVTQRFQGTVLAPRTGVMGAVMFVGQTGRLMPEGRRALDLLAAAVPRGATNVQVQVFGWAEAKRTTRAVLQLGATRVSVTNRELLRRRVIGSYTSKVGGRYPVPGRTGRRSEVVITWDN